MKRIKTWYLNLIFDLFIKNWKYDSHFLTALEGLSVGFKTNKSLHRPIMITKAERNDITPYNESRYYLAQPARLDAGWVFKDIVLKSQKTVTLYICAKEDKLKYMSDFEALRMNKKNMLQEDITMNCVMDIDVQVIGPGKGLTSQERQEMREYIKTAELI